MTTSEDIRRVRGEEEPEQTTEQRIIEFADRACQWLLAWAIAAAIVLGIVALGRYWSF